MNDRPLPFILAAFVLGEVWIWQFQRTAAFAALILVLFILVGIIKAKRSSFFCLFCLFVCGFFLGGVTEYRWLQKKEDFERWKNDKYYLIEGQIEEKNAGEKTIALTIKNLKIVIDGEEGKIDGEEDKKVDETGEKTEKKVKREKEKNLKGKNLKRKNLKGRLLIYADMNHDYSIGHRILFWGKIESFSLPTNPGEFNLRRYEEGRGIFGYCSKPDITTEWYGSFLIGDGLRKIREKLAQTYRMRMTNTQSGPAMAMVLGDKSELSKEQKELYQLGGISHILAVSGLHMTLVGAGLYRILRRAGFGYGIASCFSLPCILAYAMLTGKSSSCLRAALMLNIYLLGEWLGRSYDLYSSLSLSGILLLIEIPDRLFDSSFLLSFGAMGGIGLFYPAVKSGILDGFKNDRRIEKEKKRWKSILHQIKTGLFGSLSVTVFTLPLSLCFFYGISIAGIFLNLLVIPLMSVLFLLLSLGGCLSLFKMTSMIGQAFLFAGGQVIDFYGLLCKRAEKIPGGYLTLGYRDCYFAFVYYMILGIFLTGLFLLKRKRRKKEISKNGRKKIKLQKRRIRVLSLSTTLSLLLLIAVTGRNDTFFTVLDVGQGDGILFHNRSGEVIFVDGGSTSKKEIGNDTILPALSYYGISAIDNWIVSHTDQDHISGLVEILEKGYPIRRLILPRLNMKSEKEKELELIAKRYQTQVYYLAAKDKLVFQEGVLTCLHPSKENPGANENENSLVVLLSLPFQDIFLTGDVEKNGEEILSKTIAQLSLSPQKERILKVAHHGSANSTGKSFLTLTHPHIAIISCGVHNRYGHPASETVKRLQEAGAEIFRTDRQGAIEIRCKSKTEYYCFGQGGE